MFKILVTALLSLFAAAAFAAVDVNKAGQAELESVKGIGPSMSGKILDARKSGPFTDWADLRSRVKGVGSGNAAKYSADGLTVNGATYAAAAEPETRGKKASAAKPAMSDKADKAGKADQADKKAVTYRSPKPADGTTK